jgi:signal transduction histidine kinase
LQLRRALIETETENHARKLTEAELRKTEAELRALNEKLEARVGERTAELVAAKEAALSASQQKSTFLATMSHELRTPVAGIVGLVELLGRCELPPEARSMLEPLLSSSKTLLSLIGDVLDYSKIEAGKLEVERIPVRVRATLRDVILLLRPKADAQSLKLELVVEDAVPNFILCDPTRLQQIVLNLAGNAIKFTPSGSVHVRASYRDDTLTLAVKDTGIGISHEAQARLFSAFVQAEPSTSRKYSGSGLGLMITKRLAQLLGGDVTVQSELGVGSTFTCTLKAPVAARPRTEPESLPDRLRPLRILLAEDNDINAFILMKLLSHLGHSCDRVSDGEQAVARASQKSYDAILMDMHMPVLDGIEATRKIRALPDSRAQVPIIGLSADAITDHEAEYKAAGLSDYLVKPCTLAQLQHALAQRTALS